jgi:hypothetical protein
MGERTDLSACGHAIGVMDAAIAEKGHFRDGN